MTKLLVKVAGKDSMIIGYAGCVDGTVKAVVVVDGGLKAVTLADIELPEVPRKLQKAIARATENADYVFDESDIGDIDNVGATFDA